MDAASRPAVVIDNGTGYTKMGFAGNVEPCFITPAVVAVNDSFSNQTRASTKGNWLAQHSTGVMVDLDFFIGEEALARSRSSSTYSLSYPIHNGQVENWDTMERFWQQCIFNYLRCDPEDHYFLLTESPLTAPETREYTGEIMFETFNVPDNMKIKHYGSILIIGGGLSGVEIAVNYPDKKVTLVHDRPRLLESIGQKAGGKALRWLRSKNVKFLLDQLVDLESMSEGDMLYKT